jgi:hypothetical protein
MMQTPLAANFKHDPDWFLVSQGANLPVHPDDVRMKEACCKLGLRHELLLNSLKICDISPDLCYRNLQTMKSPSVYKLGGALTE